MAARYQTIVIGAGLAGLCCARTLGRNGREVVVLEASDEVGGRVRTDVVETAHGRYLLDRGFQVYLDAYEEGARVLDLKALELGAFEPGAQVFVGGGWRTVMDPRRRPLAATRALLPTWAGGGGGAIAGPLDTARIAWLAAQLTAGRSDERAWHGPNRTALDALRHAGISQRTIDRFFRPFFGGVFFDESLGVSERVLRFCFRNFARGRATLPAAGMGAIPRQIAEALGAGRVRTGARVVRVGPGGVVLATGERLESERVVIATEGDGVSRLLGRFEAPAWRSTVTVWFDAPGSPTGGAVLALNGEGRSDGPVNHLACVSDAQARYAPPGRALIAANVIGAGDAHDGVLVRAIRRQLGGWFGVDRVRTWTPLRVHRIRRALPVASPDVMRTVRRSVRAGPSGVYLCGDHLDNPSINGAMESGRRAAEAVLEDTGG